MKTRVVSFVCGTTLVLAACGDYSVPSGYPQIDKDWKSGAVFTLYDEYGQALKREAWGQGKLARPWGEGGGYSCRLDECYTYFNYAELTVPALDKGSYPGTTHAADRLQFMLLHVNGLGSVFAGEGFTLTIDGSDGECLWGSFSHTLPVAGPTSGITYHSMSGKFASAL